MAKIQEYAVGLREAAIVRDALVQRRDELSRQLVAQHSFTFGLPHAGTGPDTFQRLRITAARDEVADTLAFWLQSFPLLTRLSTGDINAGSGRGDAAPGQGEHRIGPGGAESGPAGSDDA